jgi:uncharacterized protein (DUF736 family)
MSTKNTRKPELSVSIEIDTGRSKKRLFTVGALWKTEKGGYTGTYVDTSRGYVHRLVVLPIEPEFEKGPDWSVHFEVGEGRSTRLQEIGAGWSRKNGEEGFTGSIFNAFGGQELRLVCIPPTSKESTSDADEDEPF